MTSPLRSPVRRLFPVVLAAAWVLLYRSLDRLADALMFGLLGLRPGNRLAEALRFFVYEVPKVLLLLVLIVFVIGIVRTYFAPERTRRLLEGRSLFLGNVMAASLGIVTPFCSCSAVPLFLGFVEAGIPLGVTFSFLIAAPMINEVAVVMLFSLFGWKTALVYMATGLGIAITAGWTIGRLRLERWVEPWVYEMKAGPAAREDGRIPFSGRVAAGNAAVREIVGKVWPYVVGGIAVGAAVHGYVPENFMASIMGKSAWWSVPLSVIIGVPLYSNAAGIIPIVQALLEKGASLGTALAFMMSVIGLSFPEAVILRKVLKIPLLLTFFGIVALGIMAVGFVFNLIF
jgi:uncharacterized membrane protein YraQ (UPF0718 family)